MAIIAALLAPRRDRPSAGPAAPGGVGAPLPEGVGVALDRRVRRLADGAVLIGGSPTRIVRLTAAGARLVDAWAAGVPPEGRAARVLARRLVDAGIAHPRPRPAASDELDRVTIVIPVRDRDEQLARCLAAIGPTPAAIVVVDDGSRDPDPVRRVADRHGATVVRRATSEGAAAARNHGLAHSRTEHVAFVDSDCLPSANWLRRLLPHLDDPRVGAVAPRIVAGPAARDGWLARFEAERSPLDMGPDEGPVAPLSRLPYVPTAALLVRRRAASAGFDPAMAIGEDVDLVWRMTEAGWTVRYDPSATVAHDHRVTLGPWLRRRYVYGTSAAALAVRHRGAIPAAVVTPFAAAFWALLAARRPAAALAVGGAAAWSLRRRLAGGTPVGAGTARSGGARPPLAGGALTATETARLVAAGFGWSGWSLAVAATRPWLPLALLTAARSRRARRLLLAGAVAPRAVEALRGTPGVGALPALAATVADDAAYAAGVWAGCVRERTLAPLLPSLTSIARPRRLTAASGAPSRSAPAPARR